MSEHSTIIDLPRGAMPRDMAAADPRVLRGAAYWWDGEVEGDIAVPSGWWHPYAMEDHRLQAITIAAANQAAGRRIKWTFVVL